MPHYGKHNHESHPGGDSRQHRHGSRPHTSSRRSSRERPRPAHHAERRQSGDAFERRGELLMSGALPAADGRTPIRHNENGETTRDTERGRRRQRSFRPYLNERSIGEECGCEHCSEWSDSSDGRRRQSSATAARPLKGILKKPRVAGHQELKRKVSFRSDARTGKERSPRPAEHTSRDCSMAAGPSSSDGWPPTYTQPGTSRPQRRNNGSESNDGSEEDVAKDIANSNEEVIEEKNGIDNQHARQTAERQAPQAHGPRQAWFSYADCVHPEASTSTRAQRSIDIARVQHDLLHSHQTWCRGRCVDTQEFARRLGACGRCARSMTEPIHPSARCALMPICRTWIHCCSKAGARDLIFGSGRSSNSEDGLRIGFADAYVCELRGYIGVEAYLAFLRSKAQETALFEWLLEPRFKTALDQATLLIAQGPESSRTMECERQEYLDHVAKEAMKTGELWASIVACLTRYGERVNQGSVGRLVDEWILGQTSRYHRRPRRRLH